MKKLAIAVILAIIILCNTQKLTKQDDNSIARTDTTYYKIFDTWTITVAETQTTGNFR